MAAQLAIDITSSPAGTQQRIPPSSHRLATVSASDALQELEDSASSFIPTGIPSLDSVLAGAGPHVSGGLERGKVTELWGPSGAGTTAVALQASFHALRQNQAVIWIDCATPLSESRLLSLLDSTAQPASDASQSKSHLERFKHISAPTLSHLLALVLHPRAGFCEPGTALLVIDNVNMLIDLDYPRAQAMNAGRTEAQKWQAGRRYAVLGALVTGLSKFSALNSLAVVATTGCAMRTRPNAGLGGALAPGVGGAEWDGGVWNRIVVFKDFAGRFVGVQKCGGKSLISREEIGEPGRIIGFDISTESGALQERYPSKGANGAAAVVKINSSPAKARKRHFHEVADSEDEDEYGWDAGDEEVFGAGTVAVGESGTDAPTELAP